MHYRPVRLCLVSVALATGCHGGLNPVGASAKHPAGTSLSAPAATATPRSALEAATPSTRIISQLVGVPTSLSGTVKLLSDQGNGIVSNNGSGIITDNGGGIIANNGGGLVSDNGGGIVSNNGSGLVGKAHFGLLVEEATQVLREFSLADAPIQIYDATGSRLVDTQGKPLMATSDKHGNYTLAAVLPTENLVLRTKLWNGGELSAMLVHSASNTARQPIDTGSSLGAAYVLSKYVNADQQTFNKLPASYTERLHLELAATRALLKATPSYTTTALVTLTDQLRRQAPTVDKTLSDIQALLLGQANLGAGQKATDVALQAPLGLTVDAGSNLYVTESGLGRVRAVAPDGTLTTYVDAVFGKAKQSYPHATDACRGPDGTLYIGTIFEVHHINADGTATLVAGSGNAKVGPAGLAATLTDLNVHHIAVSKDGTLYIAEGSGDQGTPYLLAVGHDGIARQVAPAAWGQGNLDSLRAGSDGALYVSFGTTAGSRLYRLHPDGSFEELTAVEKGEPIVDNLMPGPDGTFYLTETGAGRVVAVAPDGTKRILLGRGAVGDAGLACQPSETVLAPDGTLYVADQSGSLVYALAADGHFRIAAGTTRLVQDGDSATISIDTPGGVAFDPQGNLLLAETGANRIKRYDGHTYTTIAGTISGFAGDGGPATAAKFSAPSAIATRGDRTVVLDLNNACLRAIDGNGIVSTITGVHAASAGTAAFAAEILTKDHPADAKHFDLAGSTGLAFGADGLIYWTDVLRNQIQRLSPDGTQIQLVAGPPAGNATVNSNPAAGLLIGLAGGTGGDGGPALAASLAGPTGVAFDAHGDLFVADTGNCRIRKISGLATATPQIENVVGVDTPTSLARGGPNVRDEEGTSAKNATLIAPVSVCFGPDGTLYIGELGSTNIGRLSSLRGGSSSSPLGSLDPSTLSPAKTYARIRKVLPDGRIFTIAGPGGLYFPDPQAADALVAPTYLAVDPSGRLVIVDGTANVIRFLPAGSF